ncbi:MAG TPA: hypothetical protein VM778_02980 [Gemmatimonadota bacterium]|nr:hypothetical protein [Gemmatimonadota bacterium]
MRPTSAAACALLLAVLAVPARGQSIEESPGTPALVATVSPAPTGLATPPEDALRAPLRPDLLATDAAPGGAPYAPVVLADRQTILKTAIGGALIGCAIGVFMGPEEGSAFGCAMGALAGGGLGALLGSGL